MPSRLRNNLRKLAGLDARAFADLLLAQWALLRAEWQMRTQPIGSLTVRDATRDTTRTDARSATPSSLSQQARARAIANAVRRAADFGLFRPFCLVRAMALRALLEREQIHGSEIRIGVRRRDGAFAAHAWIRWNNEILGDIPSHVATFTEVDDIRVLGRS